MSLPLSPSRKQWLLQTWENKINDRTLANQGKVYSFQKKNGHRLRRTVILLKINVNRIFRTVLMSFFVGFDNNKRYNL